VDKVQTMYIVSVNFSHAVFSLLSTHDYFVMQAFVHHAKYIKHFICSA